MFETDSRTALWGISPILLVVGEVFHVCSLAAPHWLANSQSNMGLWTYCTRSVAPAASETGFTEPLINVHCVKVNHVLNNNSAGDYSWFRAVQGVEIAATVFVLTSLVTALMRVNLGHRLWQIACGLSALIAGAFGTTGAIVFGKNYGSITDLTLSWAYVFNAASSAALLVSGPILIGDALLNTS